MTRTFENAEELFRFASTRAPSALPQPAGLIRLADETEVLGWIASAHQQDFAQELIALEARWQALAGAGVNEESTQLRIGSDSAASTDTTLPAILRKDPSATREIDELVKSLWKFTLQGISSGAAQAHQLHRVQQMLGQASALQQPGEPTLQTALRPVLKLPAVFEAHLAERRALAITTLAADSGATRAELEARLTLQKAFEARLVYAIAHPPVFDAAQPFSAPVPKPDPDAPRTYYFQPAADPVLLFRVAYEELMAELDDAGIATVGLTVRELLDTVRREIATVAVQISVLPADTPLPQLPPGATFGIRPVGVADLRVVKQELVGYEKGELAEIHSVAHGETVERQTSRLQRADDGQSEWNVRDNERWRETYTVERNDLGRYAYLSARQNSDQNASVNFSGKYGEIQINGSAFLSDGRGRDETRAEDVRRSRELVERALQLTRESVGLSRWRNLTTETQSSTLHKQKSQCGNIVSRYHYVDKVYQAQVFNCGARAMYEVMVPAPAALLLQLLRRQPGRTPLAGLPPVRPTLVAADITDSSWALLAERYGVVLPPPPAVAITEYAQASSRFADAAPLARGGVFTRGAALEQGYEASIAGVSMAWIGVAGQSGLTVSIGALLFSSSQDTDEPIAPQAMAGETGDVSYSASAWGMVDQYTVNFYLVWTRTQRAVEQWQLACYQIIVEDYQRRLAQYREQAAVALTPEQMRAIERTELKRAVLEVIRRGTGQSTQAPQAVINTLPAIDVARLEAAAREVRFFEYAFEWEQMTYRFYPYFWAAENTWSADSFVQQGDSVFTAFLNAGFASVILPVRKGFEDAAAIYLKTGVVLDLAVVPADDDLAALNCEVAQLNAECEGGVSEGDPWSYRVPTTMTVLDESTTCALPRV